MRKQTNCICENKGADQLRSNCKADQRLCFRYMDSTIPLLSKSKISSICSLWPVSVAGQAGLCRTWSVPKLLVFSLTGSLDIHVERQYLITKFSERQFAGNRSIMGLTCSTNNTGN